MKYLLAVILFFVLFGCGATRMSYSPSSVYSENDIRDITDEDIQKAFEAKPQIVLPTKIAWYNMGRDSLYKSLLINNDDITLNYIIPKSLIEGFSPYIGDYYEPYYYYSRPTSVNIKSLRLLAARAKCDLIILVSTRFGEQREINSLAWFNIFILPMLFTKYTDVTYSFDAEIYIFDVRNGYMYKHAKIVPNKIKKSLNTSDFEKSANEVNKVFMKQSSEYLKKEIYSALKNSN